MTAPASPAGSGRHAWEAPGAFAVADGVHRIPLPLPNDGLRAVNVYAIEDDGGLVMIDSGWALAEARQQLETALAALGYDLRDVRQFLVTHAHRDHYTLGTVVRRLLGTKVALGAGEAPVLGAIRASRPGHFAGPLLDRLRAGGAAGLVGELEQYADTHPRERIDPRMWDDPDEWLHDGTKIELAGRVLRVIATPGHTRGHVVFHDPGAGLLFSGDHVLPHITPSIGFESVPSHRPLAEYLESLAVVGELADCRMLPAHGPVQPRTRGRISELVEHHRVRLEATLAAVAGGAVTALEVAQRLPWTSRERAFADLDRFNQMLAVNETIAHLQVLAERGELRARRTGGVLCYAL